MASQLQGGLRDALDDLRDLARGIYPPLLADKGLAAALEAQGRKAAVPTTVEPDGIGRYPREIEAAVYFCALEAMQNVAKYAEATFSGGPARRARRRRCIFEIEDDGRGFDADTTTYGTGLQGMADRLDAIGGTLDIRSAPGRRDPCARRGHRGPERRRRRGHSLTSVLTISGIQPRVTYQPRMGTPFVVWKARRCRRSSRPRPRGHRTTARPTPVAST